MTKLVTVAHGRARGVYVDARRRTRRRSEWSTRSTSSRGCRCSCPSGVANGFQALATGTQYAYCFDHEWSPTHARTGVQPARSARRRPVAVAVRLRRSADTCRPRIATRPPSRRWPVKLFVTGAAGFIGSNYVRWVLANSDHEVTVFDKLTYAGNLDNIRDVLDDRRCRFVQGDICDQDAVLASTWTATTRSCTSRPSRTSTARSSTPTRSCTTNTFGTSVLCDVARQVGVERFLHISTDEVYGSIESGSFDESDRLTPRSPYSAAKAGSDLIALSYHTTYGLPVVVTRCSNNYGPYQFPEKLIPLFTTNLLDGKRVPLMGDGGNVRDWIHVEDHNRAAQLVLERGVVGEIYNIGAHNEITNREITDAAARAHRPRRVVHRVGARPARARPSVQRRDRQDHRPRLEGRARLRDRAGADGRLVPRSPRLVGAAQGPRRARLMRVLVTGAGGQLGHELVAALRGGRRRRRRRSTRAQLDVGDRARRVAGGRRASGPTSSSTPRRGRQSTPARAIPSGPFATTPTPCGGSAQACDRGRCPSRPDQHRLRVRRHARPPVP